MKRAVPPAPPAIRKGSQPPRPVPQKATVPETAEVQSIVKEEILLPAINVEEKKRQPQKPIPSPIKKEQPVRAPPVRSSVEPPKSVPASKPVPQVSAPTLNASHNSLQDRLRQVQEERLRLQSSLLQSDEDQSSSEAQQISIPNQPQLASEVISQTQEQRGSQDVIQAVESSQQSQPKLRQMSSQEGREEAAEPLSKQQIGRSVGEPQLSELPMEKQQIIQVEQLAADPYQPQQIELPIEPVPQESTLKQKMLPPVEEDVVPPPPVEEEPKQTEKPIEVIENIIRSQVVTIEQRVGTIEITGTIVTEEVTFSQGISIPEAPIVDIRKHSTDIDPMLHLSHSSEISQRPWVEPETKIILTSLREQYERLKQLSSAGLDQLQIRERAYLQRIGDLRQRLERQEELISKLVRSE